MRNSRRIAGPFIDLNFGPVETDWQGKPSPTIALQALVLDGKTAFVKELSLGELRIQ